MYVYDKILIIEKMNLFDLLYDRSRMLVCYFYLVFYMWLFLDILFWYFYFYV